MKLHELSLENHTILSVPLEIYSISKVHTNGITSTKKLIFAGFAYVAGPRESTKCHTYIINKKVG